MSDTPSREMTRVELIDRIRELHAELAVKEEAEARCCPEDVGFEEWIAVLTKRNAALREALTSCEAILSSASDQFGSDKAFPELSSEELGRMWIAAVEQARAALKGSPMAAVAASSSATLEELRGELERALVNSEGNDFQISASFVRELITALAQYAGRKISDEMQHLPNQALQSAGVKPCDTCDDDPEVCATVPSLRHCEAANRSQSASGASLDAAESTAPSAITGVTAEVAAERSRQIEQEGWDHDHDDGHVPGALAKAGACYAAGEPVYRRYIDDVRGDQFLTVWPWSSDWWKPKNRRRDLIRAAALIVAEIERIDRNTPDRSSDVR